MRKDIATGALIGVLIPALIWIAEHFFGHRYGGEDLLLWPASALLFAAADEVNHPSWAALWLCASAINVVWYAGLASLLSFFRRAVLTGKIRFDYAVRQKERWVTRIAAFAIGLFSILTPLLAYMTHENSEHEWATAGPLKLIALLAGCAICAAFGTVFLAVGIKGAAPAWLAKHLNSHNH